MNMPTDKEQLEILNSYNGPITDKVKAIVSRVEERILKENVRPLAEKLEEHDGFISKIKRNFLGIVKG